VREREEWRHGLEKRLFFSSVFSLQPLAPLLGSSYSRCDGTRRTDRQRTGDSAWTLSTPSPLSCWGAGSLQYEAAVAIQPPQEKQPGIAHATTRLCFCARVAVHRPKGTAARAKAVSGCVVLWAVLWCCVVSCCVLCIVPFLFLFRPPLSLSPRSPSLSLPFPSLPFLPCPSSRLSVAHLALSVDSHLSPSPSLSFSPPDNVLVDKGTGAAPPAAAAARQSTAPVRVFASIAHSPQPSPLCLLQRAYIRGREEKVVDPSSFTHHHADHEPRHQRLAQRAILLQELALLQPILTLHRTAHCCPDRSLAGAAAPQEG